ncbi:chloride channel protein 2-like isoform X2 [Ptychodera flava]|uniref:chloride channel protein 2-like isoform X2 n=1 Tax=Ptychodera flava TaxID=63121 RepID=UPI00396A9B23
MANMQDATSRQLGYEQTLMYGRYTRDLGLFAKTEAARIRRQEEAKKEKNLKLLENRFCTRCCSYLVWAKDAIFGRIGEDWIFLLVLGVVMALLSFLLDYAIAKFQTAHVWFYYELQGQPILQYLAWVSFPIVFIMFSTGFTHLVGPNAIGSGIPEMKTILRGVILKEYLTFRTLISKMVGLATSIGSSLPIGKEGPFVHIASMVANLLGKLIRSSKGVYENESRNYNMLAAACAVGVSCTFSAPIGGVLFSIEVTATYFAVSNYWRGFFSAVCSAFVFRLMAVWVKEEETITALFKTSFRVDFPFDVQEFIAFSLIGVVTGFGGALFVYIHRKIVEFNRKHKRARQFLQKNRFIYPTIVAFVISSLTFPLGVGQFMAGELTSKQALNELFSNTTWTTGQADMDDAEVISHWKHPNSNIYVTLVIFIVMRFWMTAVAVTLPVPAGVFMPVFIIGAAFGRLVGECMAAWFPDGVRSGEDLYRIVPGGYAVVGAAALSGSVTHTISTSVIVFELTGQIVHILPVMIAVLIANAIAHLLQPSIYDSIIQIKRLPYLPDFANFSTKKSYNVFVEDIMIKHVRYLSFDSTYQDLKILLDMSKHSAYPIVDNKDSMILLGSMQKHVLEQLLDSHVGRVARLAAFSEMQRQKSASDNNLAEGRSRHDDSEEITVLGLHPQSNASVTSTSSIKSILKKSKHLFTGSDSGAESSDVSQVDRGSLDMTPEEQASWENEKLQELIKFDNCQIDPAPFQLVEKTSLHKVHSLFSLLGLNHAYVTTLGRLVGVVALKEVRRAIEGSHLYDSSDSEADGVSDEDETTSENSSSRGQTEHELQMMVENKRS